MKFNKTQRINAFDTMAMYHPNALTHAIVSLYINLTFNDYLKHSASDWLLGFDIIAFSIKN